MFVLDAQSPERTRQHSPGWNPGYGGQRLGAL